MVKNRLRPALASCAALALLAAIGCGGEERGYLEGTVLLNGQPVGPGSIMLAPVDTTKPGALANFGEDGKYKVVSARRKEGALTGEYRVTIHGGEDYGEEGSGPRPKSNIPARYGDAAKSDLTVTIEPGTNTKDFELTP